MKKINKILLTFSVVLALGSCDDIIDLTERDGTSGAGITSTPEGIEATLAAVYSSFKNIHQSPEIGLYKQCGTDVSISGTNMADVTSGGMRGMMEYNDGFSAVSDEIDQLWNIYYQAIARANDVVFGVGLVENPDAELLDYLGQALILRAYSYLELVRRWENIIITERLPDGTPPVFDAIQVPKEDVYDIIIDDLNTAVPLLFTRAQNGSVLIPSKGMANLLLAEANLDMGNWQAAANAAEDLIADGSYMLQPLDGIFGLVGGKAAAGEENNAELIFSLGFDPGTPEVVQFTSQQFVPLYDRLDGLARTMEQGGRPWSRFSPSEYYWSVFEEEDGRLEAWHKLEWIFDDADALPDGVELGDVATYDDAFNQFGDDPVRLRYIEPTTTKLWEDDTYGRTTAEAEGWRNMIVYRYSQAFIVSAEAHLRLGDVGTATARLNVLRERAFGDGSHNFATITMDDLIDEHARELGHEGHRWHFLNRLGLLYQRTLQYNSSAQSMTEKNVRWPLPQSFIDLTGLTQNPNY